MSTNYWLKYVEKRYIAQQRIIEILEQEGVYLTGEASLRFNPPTLTDFRREWRDTSLQLESATGDGSLPENPLLNPGNRRAVLGKDTESTTIDVPNDRSIIIMFISPEVKSGKQKEQVTETKLNRDLMPTLLRQMSIQQSKMQGGDVIVDNISFETVTPGIEVILITDRPLQGKARKKIANLNLMLEKGIRHFTVDELQFNPTKHMDQPIVEKATEEEIEALIARQIDLLIGRHRLADRYKERRQALNDDFLIEKLDEDVRREILSKLPTFNSTDVLVKWYGFKIGDVIKIRRRSGNSKFAYRRVIFNIKEIQ